MKLELPVGFYFDCEVKSVFTRWECLDFKAQNPYRSFDWAPPEVLEKHREEFPNPPLEALREQVEYQNGVDIVRTRLQAGSPTDDFVQLWAHKRLDLTLEALAIRPAWAGLFSASELKAAEDRLCEALASDPECETPPAEGASRTAWLREKLLSVESDPWQSPISAEPGRDFRCETIRQMARDFDTTGWISAPFWARRHYRICHACARAVRWIEPAIGKLDARLFQWWRERLSVLTACIGALESNPAPGVAWRALVCGSAARLPAPGLWRRGMSNPADALFHQWAAALTEVEVACLYFAAEVSSFLCDPQVNLYPAYVDDGPVYEGAFEEIPLILPTGGDLSTIPGVVDAVRCSDSDHWLKVMTGREDGFPQDAWSLFRYVWSTAALKRRLDVISAPPPEPAVDIPSAIRLQADCVADLREAVESNSAAQVPLIDTLQHLLASMPRASRRGAEESLRAILGDRTYRSLCPAARHAAIVAEYCWLDAEFPDPSNIVKDLATAFERQVREGLLKPFRDALVAEGLRNYPDFASPKSQCAAPGMPGAPQLPVLIRNGKMSDRLTLGDMRVLLNQPLPSMSRILGAWGIDAVEVSRICALVAEPRNRAVHGGDITREEAEDIRMEWLGLAPGAKSIFAAAIPSKAMPALTPAVPQPR